MRCRTARAGAGYPAASRARYRGQASWSALRRRPPASRPGRAASSRPVEPAAGTASPAAPHCTVGRSRGRWPSGRRSLQPLDVLRSKSIGSAAVQAQETDDLVSDADRCRQIAADPANRRRRNPALVGEGVLDYRRLPALDDAPQVGPREWDAHADERGIVASHVRHLGRVPPDEHDSCGIVRHDTGNLAQDAFKHLLQIQAAAEHYGNIPQRLGQYPMFMFGLAHLLVLGHESPEAAGCSTCRSRSSRACSIATAPCADQHLGKPGVFLGKKTRFGLVHGVHADDLRRPRSAARPANCGYVPTRGFFSSQGTHGCPRSAGYGATAAPDAGPPPIQYQKRGR